MTKTELTVLEKIKAGKKSFEVIHYKGRSYGAREFNAVKSLVEMGVVEKIKIESMSSTIQQSRGFGRLGGSYRSTSVIIFVKYVG